MMASKELRKIFIQILKIESSSNFAGLILTAALKMVEVIGNEFENPELLKEVLNVN